MNTAEQLEFQSWRAHSLTIRLVKQLQHERDFLRGQAEARNVIPDPDLGQLAPDLIRADLARSYQVSRILDAIENNKTLRE